MFPYPQYNSLAFLDPVPTIFILLSILLSLNYFFIFSAKEAHLQIKEKKGGGKKQLYEYLDSFFYL